MFMKSSLVLITFCLLDLFISQRNRGKEPTSNDFTNLQVNRTIDLSFSIIKIKSEVLIKSMKVDPIYSYVFPILKNSTKNLINLSAKLKSSSGDEEVISLKVSKINLQVGILYDYYEVNFKSEPMNYEEERILIISEHYYEKLQLLPKKITIKENQLVIFSDSINHISFYHTISQRTIVTLPHERTDIV